MVDINDVRNYKSCREKQADFWMCMPSKGSYIHTFRINTDKNILDFFEYVMKFIRKNLRES